MRLSATQRIRFEAAWEAAESFAGVCVALRLPEKIVLRQLHVMRGLGVKLKWIELPAKRRVHTWEYFCHQCRAKIIYAPELVSNFGMPTCCGKDMQKWREVNP